MDFMNSDWKMKSPKAKPARYSTMRSFHIASPSVAVITAAKMMPVSEFISMNFMMAGMSPVMSFLMMGRDMRAMEPTELLFWGVMSLGVIAGFILAYPSNVWMVARQLKHGLMTQRKPEWKAVAVPV